MSCPLLLLTCMPNLHLYRFPLGISYFKSSNIQDSVLRQDFQQNIQRRESGREQAKLEKIFDPMVNHVFGFIGVKAVNIFESIQGYFKTVKKKKKKF